MENDSGPTIVHSTLFKNGLAALVLGHRAYPTGGSDSGSGSGKDTSTKPSGWFGAVYDAFTTAEYVQLNGCFPTNMKN